MLMLATEKDTAETVNTFENAGAKVNKKVLSYAHANKKSSSHERAKTSRTVKQLSKYNEQPLVPLLIYC